LRILELDGVDGEPLAEVERCLTDRLSGEMHPEVERITGGAAVEALEEVASEVDREAA
jgi:hypothetical protein